MKKPIKLRNPSYTRPWLYILDVIEGYLILGKALLKIKKGNYFDTFNLAPSSNKVYDVLALTKVVLKKLNFEKFEFDSSLNNKENQFLSLSACKIKKHLGWKSKTSFKNLIHFTVKWYLANLKNNNLTYTENHICSYFNIAKGKKLIKFEIPSKIKEKKYA